MNDNGFITKEDLKHVMGGLNLTDGEFNKIFEHYDTNHDGKVK
jgi:Ca2+-binding EF-hand superfamily protein